MSISRIFDARENAWGNAQKTSPPFLKERLAWSGGTILRSLVSRDVYGFGRRAFAAAVHRGNGDFDLGIGREILDREIEVRGQSGRDELRICAEHAIRHTIAFRSRGCRPFHRDGIRADQHRDHIRGHFGSFRRAGRVESVGLPTRIVRLEQTFEFAEYAAQLCAHFLFRHIAGDEQILHDGFLFVHGDHGVRDLVEQHVRFGGGDVKRRRFELRLGRQKRMLGLQMGQEAGGISGDPEIMFPAGVDPSGSVLFAKLALVQFTGQRQVRLSVGHHRFQDGAALEQLQDAAAMLIAGIGQVAERGADGRSVVV